VRILLTGNKGMLGQDFTAWVAPRHEIVPLDLPEVDITDAAAVGRYFTSAEPEGVIHAAAFTAVDECERRPEMAFAVNGEGTRNVARAARDAGIPMLYISTDYVFDGAKPEPYHEEDATCPLGIYGKSKFEGEKAVRDLVVHYRIVRTSWLFGPLGKNFVRTILERAKAGEKLRVVDDQVGAPTYTMHLAAVLEQILTRGGPGTYHATNQGFCSWFEFARTILAEVGLDPAIVSPIPTSASGRPAPRPRNSRLASTKLQSEGISLLPSWQEGLRSYLKREPLVGNAVASAELS
jgi:dTDP-4-dehydrorhamnose reductase